MSQSFNGKLEIKNSNGSGTAIVLNGNALPQNGIQRNNNPLRKPKSFLTGQLDIKDDDGKVVMSLGIGEIKLGKHEISSGSIELMNALTGKSQLKLNGLGTATIGGAGILSIHDSDDNEQIVLEANKRSLTINSPMDIRKIQLDAENGVITNGLMKLMADGEVKIPRSMRLEKGRLRLGAEPNGQGDDGGLMLRNSDGQVMMQLDAGNRRIEVSQMMRLENGTLRVGSNPSGGGTDGMILLRNAAGKEMVRLDGKEGDIILQNADCAEEFDVAEDELVEAGTVMVLDDNGQLRVSDGVYDKKVAGVVSGAGEYKPGIILDKQPGNKSRHPIALMGKVYCKVDARQSPISVGDLLTTSETPGHAMKANDVLQAFGAVLGKALGSLTEGVGMIPVLVSLQ